MPYVFVYGTLKRGFCNHRLLEKAAFVKEVKTRPHYLLFDLGPYPAMVVATDRGDSIRGELYHVDTETLARLDQLEGHPYYYRRETMYLAEGEFDQPVEVYLFQKKPEDMEDYGYWRCSGVWPDPDMPENWGEGIGVSSDDGEGPHIEDELVEEDDEQADTILVLDQQVKTLRAALKGMVELWERVHEADGPVLLGKPSLNAAKKALEETEE